MNISYNINDIRDLVNTPKKTIRPGIKELSDNYEKLSKLGFNDFNFSSRFPSPSKGRIKDKTEYLKVLEEFDKRATCQLSYNYVNPNNGKTVIRALIFESDKSDIDVQLQALDILREKDFLPSIVNFSGNQSLHFVYVFDVPLHNELLAKKLWYKFYEVLRQQTGIKFDKVFANSLIQQSALPGTWSNKSDGYSRIVDGSFKKYKISDFPRADDVDVDEMIKRHSENIPKINIKEVGDYKQWESKYLGKSSDDSIKRNLTKFYKSALSQESDVKRLNSWETHLYTHLVSLFASVSIQPNSRRWCNLLSRIQEYLNNPLMHDTFKTNIESERIEHTMVQAYCYAVEILKRDTLFNPDYYSAAPTEVTFCGEYDFNNYGITVLKSGTGTGKTVAILEHLTKIIKANDSTSCLIIVTQRTLARQIFGMVKGLGFQHYLEVEKNGNELSNCKKLVICVDSVYKLGTNQYELVFIDETPQVIQHLVNGTTHIKDHRAGCINSLQSIMRQASQVILASADHSDYETEVIKAFAPGMPLIEYNNTSPRPDWLHKNILMVDAEAKVRLAVEKSLQRGEKVFVACDTKATATEYREYFLKKIPDKNFCLVTSAENTLESEHQIYNEKYDAIFSSPSLTTGFSVGEKYFDLIACVFSNSNSLIPTSQYMQHIDRVRKCERVVMYVGLSRYVNKANAYSAGEDNYIGSDELEFTPESGTYSKHEHYIRTIQGEYLSRVFNDSQLKRAKIIHRCEQKGYNVSFVDDLEKATDTLTEAKISIIEKQINAILKAKVIDEETFKHYDKLRKTSGLSLQQRAEYERAMYAKTLYKEPELLTNNDVAFALGKLIYEPSSSEQAAMDMECKSKKLPEAHKSLRLLNVITRSQQENNEITAENVAERGVIGDLKPELASKANTVFKGLFALIVDEKTLEPLPYGTNTPLPEQKLLEDYIKQNDHVLKNYGVGGSSVTQKLNKFWTLLGYNIWESKDNVCRDGVRTTQRVYHPSRSIHHPLQELLNRKEHKNKLAEMLKVEIPVSEEQRMTLVKSPYNLLLAS